MTLKRNSLRRLEATANEAIKLAASLPTRVDTLKLKRQRVIDAFLHERFLDKPTCQEQLNLVNEEITLTELEIHYSKLEELHLEAALNFEISIQFIAFAAAVCSVADA